MPSLGVLSIKKTFFNNSYHIQLSPQNMAPVYESNYVKFVNHCKTDNLYQKNLFYRLLLFI